MRKRLQVGYRTRQSIHRSGEDATRGTSQLSSWLSGGSIELPIQPQSSAMDVRVLNLPVRGSRTARDPKRSADFMGFALPLRLV